MRQNIFHVGRCATAVAILLLASQGSLAAASAEDSVYILLDLKHNTLSTKS